MDYLHCRVQREECVEFFCTRSAIIFEEFLFDNRGRTGKFCVVLVNCEGFTTAVLITRSLRRPLRVSAFAFSSYLCFLLFKVCTYNFASTLLSELFCQWSFAFARLNGNLLYLLDRYSDISRSWFLSIFARNIGSSEKFSFIRPQKARLFNYTPIDILLRNHRNIGQLVTWTPSVILSQTISNN